MFKTLKQAYEEIPVGDTNNSPSETEPNATRSIKEIINARMNGVVLDVPEFEPFYSDLDIPDIQSMDLEEIATYREYLTSRQYDLEEELNKRYNSAPTPSGSAADTEERGKGLPTPNPQDTTNPPKPPQPKGGS